MQPAAMLHHCGGGGGVEWGVVWLLLLFSKINVMQIEERLCSALEIVFSISYLVALQTIPVYWFISQFVNICIGAGHKRFKYSGVKDFFCFATNKQI